MRFGILILTACLPLWMAQGAAPQTSHLPAQDFDTLLHRGFDFHQQNDYAHALPLLQEAWKLRPHDYFVNLLLGIDLLRSGKASAATGFLREAARVRPQEEFPCEYLGEAEAELKHYAAAAEAYNRALHAAPASPQAAIAYVDYSLSRFGEIAGKLRSSQPGLAAEYRLQAMAYPLGELARLQLLRHSVELDAGAPGIWSEIALAQAIAGQTAEAEQSLAKSRAQNSNDMRGSEAEAVLAARRSDWKAAADQLNELAQRSPMGLARFSGEWPSSLLPSTQDRLSGAAAIFFECVARRCKTTEMQAQLAAAGGRSQDQEGASGDPDLRSRGENLAEANDCAAAIPALERELAVPSSQHAPRTDAPKQVDRGVHRMFLLSWCYAEEASAVADDLPQGGEDAAQVHMMRGDILLRLQANGGAAVSEYRAALALHPGDPEILQRLAEAQLAAGQTDAAAESAEQALKLDPHRIRAMRTLAKIEMEKREYSGALQYLRPLVAADPADVAAHIQLGTAYAQTGALREALENLGPALQKGYPDEKGSLHYLLGTVLRKLGRTSEADAAFAASRKLSDDFQRSSHRDEPQATSQP